MRKSARAITTICLGLSPVVSLAALHSALAAPFLVYNPSPSEPIGLYRLTTAAPAAGRLVAFRVPPPGRAYAKQHLEYVMRGAILKEIAAGPGSIICERDGRVFIDGQHRGLVHASDRNEVPLPHWDGCHRLAAGELFAFSNRIPNSFDSRYYGPVRADDVIGVYRPVWTK